MIKKIETIVHSIDLIVNSTRIGKNEVVFLSLFNYTAMHESRLKKTGLDLWNSYTYSLTIYNKKSKGS